MRPTGRLHLGHYEGVLNNWLQLQQAHNCFFFVADWHALTTEYAEPGSIVAFCREMVMDWLAVGIDPGQSTLFIQSQVPEHAELQLLFSMFTPLAWLERVPSYKEQQEALGERDLATYGFLGYPLLQTADILLYKADLVPVGEDQAAHVELAREVARRFNYLYGREPDFLDKVKAAANRLGAKHAKRYFSLRRGYREQGKATALQQAQELLESQHNIPLADRARLLGHLEAEGRLILTEPAAHLTANACLSGLDGRKMSKSYGNTIPLCAEKDELSQLLRQMPTDPARVRKSDPGDPEKCPVWKLHQTYTGATDREQLNAGCRSAKIGCMDCKKVLESRIEQVIAPIRERRTEYSTQPDVVHSLLSAGAEQARGVARDTLREVRDVMGLRWTG